MSLSLNNILSAILFFSIHFCLGVPIAKAQALAYGAYDLFAKGSISVVGSGGAFTALSNNSSGTVFNPAGMVFGDWTFDFQGSNIRIDNKENFIGGKTGPGVPYNVQFYSSGYRPNKDWALATGLSSPYNLEISDFNSKKVLRLISADLSIARRLGKNLSFGVTGHYEISDLSYTDSSFAEKTSSNTIYPSFGILWYTKKISFGVSYSLKRSHQIDETLNNNIGSNVWFRDLETPAKLSVGLSYEVTNKTRLSIDLNQLEAPDESILPDTGLFNDVNVERFLEESKSTFHAGLEHNFINNKNTEVNFQLGGYLEPSRLISAEDRYHITFGIDVRFGPLVLGVAYDQAKQFKSTSAGFSLNIGALGLHH